jgi:propionyl-CoA carboxylase alpha chain
MSDISKILIANRGEIAIRVARTCRELGMGTVAVYSEPDRHAAHVRYMDEAYEIGPAPSTQSYLVAERIVDVAGQTGCQAVHPGYGFLAENADFAEACEAAGLIFIGPTPSAIRQMGDKTRARALMLDAKVPMAPGTVGVVESDADVFRLVEEIGFPILVKAAAGGGGKGMRVVRDQASLRSSLEAARREAQSAFGDDRVFVEKFIDRPRHIEFQVLGDTHGNCIHLFDRECSIQRRHQKVIEEAPSTALSDELRDMMGRAAVRAAQSVAYRGAGTVEFLLDEDNAFYFMEMNTRLQVEHPVTELITGLDIVAHQIAIAEGKELSLRQEDVGTRGHAIECRVYAEDPTSNFLPDAGLLTRHRAPAGPGIRVDAGVEEGDEVPIHYDPMISKLITWGDTREAAIQRMVRAIDEYEIAGVRTTLPFCRFAVQHEAFVSGRYSTRFVADHFRPEQQNHLSAETRHLAALATVIQVTSPKPGTANDSTLGTAQANPTVNGSPPENGRRPGEKLSAWQRRREFR